jgi:hypothetical protein
MSKFKGYPSGIELGARYRDRETGIVGRAVVVSFFEHACERVVLEYLKDGEIKEVGFDVPRLEAVGDEKKDLMPAGAKPGGPARNTGARSAPAR